MERQSWPPTSEAEALPPSPGPAPPSLPSAAITWRNENHHGRLEFPAPPTQEPSRVYPSPTCAPPSYDQSVAAPISSTQEGLGLSSVHLPPLVGPDKAPADGPRLPSIDLITTTRPSAGPSPDVRLPGIASLDRPPPHDASQPSRRGSLLESSTTQPEDPWWAGFGSKSARHSPDGRRGHRPSALDLDRRSGITSPMHSALTSPAGIRVSRANSVSINDPNVRLACEGLQALSNKDRSPPGPFASLPSHGTHRPVTASARTEPLATFLATQSRISPWIDRYSAGKSNWSLPLIRPAVEMMERGVTTAVDSVPRTPFVGAYAEKGVRYLLTPSVADKGEGERETKRRRKAEAAYADENCLPDTGLPPALSERRKSSASTMESPPAYDDVTSPAYTETVVSPTSRQWAERLVISTSGFGAAVNQRKLLMLRHCLSSLRQYISLVKEKVTQLQELLRRHSHPQGTTGAHACPPDAPVDEAQNSLEMRRSIDTIREQLRKLLHKVMATVNQHTAGALPESAARCIRQAIELIPANFIRRTWQDGSASSSLSSSTGHPDGGRLVNTTELGVRVSVLAQEMLASLQRVASVVEETLQSAERWCDSMGRRVNEPQTGAKDASPGQQTHPPDKKDASGDVTMVA